MDIPTSYTMDELLAMSDEELTEIERDRRAWAEKHELVGKAAQVARLLGERLADTYGPKYRYQNSNAYGTLGIFVDDYGHWSKVEWNDRTVLGGNNGNVIPGRWAPLVLALYEEAQAKARMIAEEKAYNEKVERVSRMVM